MLLKIKLILIATLYIFGALFMILYPPRNFRLSGGKIRTIRSVSNDPEYPHYMSSKEVFQIASHMADVAPDLIRLIELQPPSYSNRSVIAIELQSDKNSVKPGVLVIGGMDPMVWAAPNAILELAQKLLHDASYQTPFFNDYNWYLVPLSNPDGLDLTHSLRNQPSIDGVIWSKNISIRKISRPEKWHKNVQNEPNQPCFGTNINRNFPYHWQDDTNKAPNHCSQYYPGPKPFSTLEAQALRKYVDSLGNVVQMAIHLHANYVLKKDMILYPWRFSQRQHSNHETLQAIGEYAARQARLPDGRLYEVHQGSMEGSVAGSLSDYLSGVVGTELVYILKPYHDLYPNFTDPKPREMFVKKTLTVIQSLVRGWRSNTKQNTLSFFGRDIDF